MAKYFQYMRCQKCFCEKQSTIQLGSDLLLAFNIVTVLAMIFISILAFFSDGALWTKLAIPALIAAMTIPPTILCRRALAQTMRDWGHSEECSKRVARMACHRQTIGGGFKEMEENHETRTK